MLSISKPSFLTIVCLGKPLNITLVLEQLHENPVLNMEKNGVTTLSSIIVFKLHNKCHMFIKMEEFTIVNRGSVMENPLKRTQRCLCRFYVYHLNGSGFTLLVARSRAYGRLELIRKFFKCESESQCQTKTDLSCTDIIFGTQSEKLVFESSERPLSIVSFEAGNRLTLFWSGNEVNSPTKERVNP